MDIQELAERISPLGFKFKFQEELPMDATIEDQAKLEEALDQEHQGEEDETEGTENYKKFETAPPRIGHKNRKPRVKRD